jgi:hypothetical protein
MYLSCSISRGERQDWREAANKKPALERRRQRVDMKVGAENAPEIGSKDFLAVNRGERIA